MKIVSFPYICTFMNSKQPYCKYVPNITYKNLKGGTPYDRQYSVWRYLYSP